jgi:hypothetical protein
VDIVRIQGILSKLETVCGKLDVLEFKVGAFEDRNRLDFEHDTEKRYVGRSFHVT